MCVCLYIMRAQRWWKCHPFDFLLTSCFFSDSVQGGDEVHPGKGEEQAKDEGGSQSFATSKTQKLLFLTRCMRNYWDARATPQLLMSCNSNMIQQRRIPSWDRDKYKFQDNFKDKKSLLSNHKDNNRDILLQKPYQLSFLPSFQMWLLITQMKDFCPTWQSLAAAKTSQLQILKVFSLQPWEQIRVRWPNQERTSTTPTTSPPTRWTATRRTTLTRPTRTQHNRWQTRSNRPLRILRAWTLSTCDKALLCDCHH